MERLYKTHMYKETYGRFGRHVLMAAVRVYDLGFRVLWAAPRAPWVAQAWASRMMPQDVGSLCWHLF